MNSVVTTAHDSQVSLQCTVTPAIEQISRKFAVSPLTLPDAIDIVTFSSADDGAVSTKLHQPPAMAGWVLWNLWFHMAHPNPGGVLAVVLASTHLLLARIYRCSQLSSVAIFQVRNIHLYTL